MAKKFVARLNGEIVGKRASQNRTYTHAIVVRELVEVARAFAYDYRPTKTDRSNFDYYTEVLKAGADHPNFKYSSPAEVDKRLADYEAHLAGGFDAYVARLRDREIANFERRVAEGGFNPVVAGWAGSLALAQKAAPQHCRKGYRSERVLVAIVPAEEVSK